MKLYYVCYENLDVPGAWTTHVIEVVNHLTNIGHSVTLFAPFFENREVGDHVQVFRIKTFPVRFLKEYIYYFQLMWFLLKYGSRDHPGNIYVREMGVNFAPYCIARLFRIPVIVEINGMVTEELKQAGYAPWKLWFIRLCRKFNLRYADGLVAVTPELEKRLRRKYGITNGKLTTIENGVNIQRFQPRDKIKLRQKLKIPAEQFILVYIGSFYPHHGLFETLRIFTCLKLQEKNVKLLLVGDGNLRKNIFGYAENSGIVDDIIWTGCVPLGEIPEYISAADACLLLFNNHNGHVTGRSIKILEYMSCANPVIVSQAPELARFVSQHQCGIVVDTSDYDLASNSILQLLRNEALKETLGSFGRKAVEENYQWAHTARKIENLCTSIIEVTKN